MNTLLSPAQLLAAGGGIAALFFMVIWVLLIVFWIWMLVDCIRSSLPSTEKLIWVLVIIFLSDLGALLYYFIARKKV